MTAPDPSAELFAARTFDAAAKSSDQLPLVEEIVREISLHTDPQTMVSFFRRRARSLFGGDGSISLSRRGLETPAYRITRSTTWTHDVNPWEQPHLLPAFSGGALADLIYEGEARSVSDFRAAGDEPAREYLGDVRSLMALPLYDNGEALNMVVRFSNAPGGFDHVNLADALLTANLFGRATSSLVIAKKLEAAYAQLDFDLKRVARMQRALLPSRLPDMAGLDIAVSYRAAARAGGDYYDFFDLGGGRWGMLIADVSGHGTPAAVVMAVLRTILHGRCHTCGTPADLLSEANRQLMDQSDPHDGTFVTACYLVYDPKDGSLVYTCAGHNPPLLVDRNAVVRELDCAQSLPLGVDKNATFGLAEAGLTSGDTLLLYTDGITEATGESGEPYGRRRLLSCVCQDAPNAQYIIDCVSRRLLAFTGTRDQDDDRTLVALRVR